MADNANRVPITALQVLWAICAAAGLGSVGWASLHVASLAVMMKELSQSWSALTVALDLLFLGIPVVIFAVIEAHRLGMRWPWLWAVLAVPLPGAFLIPLFFLLRERAMSGAATMRAAQQAVAADQPAPSQNR